MRHGGLLAVPGSGKTTTLVIRLGYLIMVKRVDPSQILVVTYTVAATKDMRARFAKFFGDELAGKIQFRTINGICAVIIQEYERRIGRKAFELVTDEKRLIGITSMLYRSTTGEFATENDIKTIRTAFTYIKNMLYSEEEIDEIPSNEGYDIPVLFRMYRQELRMQHLMDYDDQMVYALQMLKKTPELLSQYQDRFRYICVDESQDTSKIQHEIIRLIAARDQNLFMVGDEDQSIYGFRAAYPEALLNFEKTYPAGKVLLMEDNFRSDAHIVSAADKFIQKNTLRHKKVMRSTRPKENKPTVIELKARKAQYEYLAKIAADCKEETAVLYRENESVIPLIDLLERRGIPYRLRNADMSFFSHRVVQDIEDILRFALNPFDGELFLRIYYKIHSYISKADAQSIVQESQMDGVDVIDAALAHFGNGKQRKNLRDIKRHLEEIVREETATEALFTVTIELGYLDYLHRAQIGDGKIALLRAIAEREDNTHSFLSRMETLQKVVLEKTPDYKCPFILSTIHSSKGLEYKTVYMMDVVDGVFPADPPKYGAKVDAKIKAAQEEERRIFYVGVTRAKDRLFLFHVGPSVYLKDFSGVKDEVTKPTPPEKKHPVPDKIGKVKVFAGMFEKKREGTDEEGLRQFISALTTGKRVVHQKYGDGIVIAVYGGTLQIEFDSVGEKMLSARLVYEKGLLGVRE